MAICNGFFTFLEHARECSLEIGTWSFIRYRSCSPLFINDYLDLDCLSTRSTVSVQKFLDHVNHKWAHYVRHNDRCHYHQGVVQDQFDILIVVDTNVDQNLVRARVSQVMKKALRPLWEDWT